MVDECSYCGDASEFEVVDGIDYTKVCKTCLREDMVILQKPSSVQIAYSYKRPTVRQVLSRMAGIRVPKESLPVQAPSLSMLRESKEESNVKKRLNSLKQEQPDQRSLKDTKISSKDASADKVDLEKEEFLDI